MPDVPLASDETEAALDLPRHYGVDNIPVVVQDTTLEASGVVTNDSRDPQVVHQLLAQRRDPLASLTPRETDVLQLMAERITNAGIARRLVVGVVQSRRT
jgi:DNA-binding NarL/FixJ family response regulator